MSDYTQTLVSALEYEGLMQLDRAIRMAVAIPNTGAFLVSAIAALDTVREEQGLPIPEPVEQQRIQPAGTQVSELAGALIQRAMKGKL